MPPQTFLAELDPAEIPSMIRQMAGIVGWKTWQHRLDGLSSELKHNPLWRTFLSDRHGLELAFANIHKRLRMTGKCPWPPRTVEEYRLYSFLAVAAQVNAKLSVHGKRKLAGAFRSSLEKEHGLGPLAFEMRVAAHLMSRGFQIEFHDLESEGGYDFLAVSGSTEIEVECKHVSADIGRQIHRRALYNLGGVLFPTIERARGYGIGGRLVQVTIPGRLTSKREQQQALADRIGSVLSGKVIAVDDRVCTVSAQSFSLEASPFSGETPRHLVRDDVEEYLRLKFNITNPNVLVNWRPGKQAILFSFESKKSDKVLRTILKRLKEDAKRQFSGDFPAFLCIHLADVTQEQLLELANTELRGTVTGIQYALSLLLQSRPHLHTVSLMTDGEVRISEERSANLLKQSIQEVGPSFVYRNPEHPLAEHPMLDRVFDA